MTNIRTIKIRRAAATGLLLCGALIAPLSTPANAATEVTTSVTSNDPPKESAPCFDGAGHWLKFTPGGRGMDQVKTEVGSPGSPILTYDEFAGSGGYPVFGIDSLVVNGAPASFAEVWVYPGGKTAYVFASPPRLTTAPTVLAPRSGRNITQVFVCAVDGPIVVGPCQGGEYLWSQDQVTGTKLSASGALTIDTGVDVPAGSLTVVSYTSFDSYTGRATVSQPNERWRVVVGAAGTGFTDDLADLVVTATASGSLAPVAIGAGRVVIQHYSVSTGDVSSPNSVVPVSVCFRVD
jgi:hypothetical protein